MSLENLQAVFPKGKVLFKEGETTREMYILLAGEVEILIGESVIAVINTSGSFIGEMATLLNAPRTATVRTTKKTVCLKILPENVETLFKVTPELGYKLSLNLAQRLSQVTMQLVNQGGGTAGNKEDRVSSKEIESAQAEMGENKSLPEQEGLSVEFLTRTEVHKAIFRYYFNHMGEKVDLEKMTDEIGCPDTLTKLILAEYQKGDLIEVTGKGVEFLYNEKLHEEIENWIFNHGLFRNVA